MILIPLYVSCSSNENVLTVFYLYINIKFHIIKK